VALCIEGPSGTLGDDVSEIALCSRHATGIEVSIRTAAAGAEAAGTAHRLDGIPLTLQAPLHSEMPTAATLLARLLEEIRG
jgi:formylmethanofuran dehydrogenase subunit B